MRNRFCLALALTGMILVLSSITKADDAFRPPAVPLVAHDPYFSVWSEADKLTGDVIACQYAHNPGKTDIEPGAFGITVCYRSGDGATKQEPGDYGLVATRHEQEGGVFRVDYRTGALSICYLYFQREKQGDRDVITDQYVVCTPPYK